jgi:iron complex transport system permease protein
MTANSQEKAASSAGQVPRLGAYGLTFVGITLLLFALFVLSLSLGSVRIPVDETLRILLGGTAEKASWGTIVLQFRLPKAITAVLAGAALAVAGLQMQTLFRNPLADPFILGISSGASLGVALVVLGTTGAIASGVLLAGLGVLGDVSVALAASMGAGAVLLLVMAAARRVQTMTLLILGLMVGYAVSALVSILLYFSIAEQIQAYVAWTFGSFGGVTWSELRVLIPVVGVSLLAVMLSAKPLNAMLLGEGYARSMGVRVEGSRNMLLVTTALLAGVVTAFCGPIGFVGVAVPHMARMLLKTANHRVLIPASVLMGGIVTLSADLIATVPGQQVVLPLNAVTALIGAPFVIWVIVSRQATINV